ncbi:hypothetical protein Dsin_031909 [Dipteronia sinensis]|uniref:At1g61320/AtMIF1 LRR domain-containing protein n=1 Tax=Dipteronia sinensis TaxID=43782 RepID=A0AAE0DSN6_9ROSI|nr:hypothetical protein Dsin_031909 [Dipteronia sinensis]
MSDIRDMEEIDRLSYLPESIIHDILSCLDTRVAIKTCVLSKTWNRRWIYSHCLSFDGQNFDKSPTAFKNFILHVLKHHKPSINVSQLRFFRSDLIDQSVVDNVLEYAISHKVEELEVDFFRFPLNLLICRSLKTLKLWQPCRLNNLVSPKYSLGFQFLKNLILYGVWIFDNDDKNSSHDLFSSCLNLENLELNKCFWVSYSKTFYISAPKLLKLIICDLSYNDMLVISAPTLEYFEFSSLYPPIDLFIDKCPALEVKIYIESDWNLEYYLQMMDIAERLSHANSLMISWNYFTGKIIFSRDTLGEEIKWVEFNEECDDYISVKGYRMGSFLTSNIY